MLSPLDLGTPAVHRPIGHDLAAYGDRTALITPDGDISYRSLGGRVEEAARRLGSGRRLVLLAGSNTVDAVVAYLGAMTAGHPVLLAPDEDAVIESLTSAYDPDVVIRPGRPYHERRTGSIHEPHPELALMMSTSGSTGSPKLVRLSYQNLRANAESIATYLSIRDTDRAATTLPLHYCYGLSVLNSHLVRGAGIILTRLSVADPCFWDVFREARGTGLAGVPYTFTLLDRIGFAEMDLPHLRYVTQAGGRMAPATVRRLAETGRARGWDLFVMYGQTEATARIAYLPPQCAATNPAAVGVPVPGGSMRLDPVDGAAPGVGELVYTGPNVMLGYAERPADLALGRTVEELRTGDLARLDADGMIEIVGRRGRFVKVFGLRIDLQRVEAGLEADGITACCAARDDELVVAVEPAGHQARLGRLIASRCGLPPRAVRVVVVPELPRLPSGKPDQRAVADLAAEPRPEPAAPLGTDLRDLYAQILDRADVTEDDTFAGLGGDSLSYVEMSVRLEAILGPLPPDWHITPIRELRARTRPATRRWMRTLDTGVALRAVSIVLVVGTHIGLFTVRGGAHLLLALAGFNVARFHLTDATRRRRLRHLAASIGRIAVPATLYLALVVPFHGRYTWQNVLLLNEVLGPRTGPERDFWFIETLVYLLLALVTVLAVPAVDRWERRAPFAVPAALLAAGLAVRYHAIPLSPWDNLSTPVLLFWFFALGWAAAKATRAAQRVLLTAVGTIAVVGYFGNPVRETVVITGLALMIWLPHVPSVAVVNRVAGVLAGSSLFIYLTHWQIYPLVADRSRLLALVASLAAGVLLGAVVSAVSRCPRNLAPILNPWRRLHDVPSR